MFCVLHSLPTQSVNVTQKHFSCTKCVLNSLVLNCERIETELTNFSDSKVTGHIHCTQANNFVSNRSIQHKFKLWFSLARIGLMFETATHRSIYLLYFFFIFQFYWRKRIRASEIKERNIKTKHWRSFPRIEIHGVDFWCIHSIKIRNSGSFRESPIPVRH